ncbi:hypothetical protein [Streptomonospora salina]|uniref:Uncharacterized protein n=1 Tax=Streptomonospora salina TaxID=104205 RepID=A0A841E3C0_9ACTN|nr:hypothetical protein [Streptomonospora salina]MBB5998327.1 hypothetical protein [Streptomonospora salina]
MTRQKRPGPVNHAVRAAQTALFSFGGVYFLLTNGRDTFLFWAGIAWIGLGLMFAVSWIRDVRRTPVHRATSSETEDAPE